MALPTAYQGFSLSVPATTASDQQLAAQTTSQVDAHFCTSRACLFGLC